MKLKKDLQALFTKKELGLVKESYRSSPSGDRWEELRQRMGLVRRLRNKNRELELRRRRRAKTDQASSKASERRSGAARKAEIFDLALKRLEDRFENLLIAEADRSALRRRKIERPVA